MKYNTPITEAGFSVRTLTAIKRTFPDAVTLGEIKQGIMDAPKKADHLGRNAYSEIEAAIAEAEVNTPAAGEIMSDTAKHAYTVHAQIILGAQMVEDGLYQMAKGFKIMRDEKLYKELGYKSFEEYCETETSINRQNVYKYISIVENLTEEFVSSRRQIGVKKLQLLAALDNEQRTEIVENTDLENTTVKELRAKIDELTGRNKSLAEDVENLTMDNERLENENGELTGENTDLEEERDRLLAENKELRNRPVETVTISQPSHEVENMMDAMKKMQREYSIWSSDIQNKHIKEIQELNINHRKETENLRREYEEKLRQSEKPAGAHMQGYFLPMDVGMYTKLCEHCKGTPFAEALCKAKLINT